MRTRHHNRQVHVIRLGVEENPFEDLYHRLVRLSWPRFFGLMILIYLTLNLVFAGYYWTLPQGLRNEATLTFWDAFAFSVQTMSTVGYGHIYPDSPAAHLGVLLETTIGLLFTAVLTGLIFVKFSTPAVRIVFSRQTLLTTHNGQPALCLRLGNIRTNRIYEGQARLTLLRDEVSQEGEKVRRLVDMSLVRSVTPIFSMSWTLYHLIDATSPFAGMSLEQIHQTNWELIVTFRGIDEDLLTDVLAHNAYAATDIVSGRKFKDMISLNGHTRVVNFEHLDEIISDPNPS